jgi:hypothetical protein
MSDKNRNLYSVLTTYLRLAQGLSVTPDQSCVLQWTCPNMLHLLCTAALLLSLPTAKIAIIVTGAVSALAVVVLSGVYTKRAIDKRLAQVHVHEEVEVEEQHFLLGSSGGAAAAAEGDDGEVMRGVVVSVEAPRYVVERSGSREVHATVSNTVSPYGEGLGEETGAGRGRGGGLSGGRWLALFKQKARVSEDEAGRNRPLGITVSRSGSFAADGGDWEAQLSSENGSSAGVAGAAAGGYRAGKQLQQGRQQ